MKTDKYKVILHVQKEEMEIGVISSKGIAYEFAKSLADKTYASFEGYITVEKRYGQKDKIEYMFCTKKTEELSKAY